MCQRMAQGILPLVNTPRVYGIPRGGIPVAYMLKSFMNCQVVNTPEEADIFVDDIIDSGETRDRYIEKYGKPFHALITQPKERLLSPGKKWYVFPWEQSLSTSSGEEFIDESITDNVIRLLQYIGENPDREGLQGTPKRFIRAWDHWCSGYGVDPQSVFKSFVDGSDNYDEMIVIKGIPFYSQCEHHMIPFFGSITVGYIPKGKIIGLSKIPRIIEVYARRLQVQERLTTEIADCLMYLLEPLGVAVNIQARHLCCESRGIQKQGHKTITNALRGVCKDLPEARSEFMSMVNNN